MISFLLPSLPPVAFKVVGTQQTIKETTVQNNERYFPGNLQSSEGKRYNQISKRTIITHNESFFEGDVQGAMYM